MADLPLEGRVVEDKKDVPLSLEQQVDILRKDIQELARGINTHGVLLQSIVVAFDHVVKKYLDLVKVPSEEKKSEV